MKQLPPYKEQYDKILEAYFKDEIKPFNSQFCFCGTLAPDGRWTRGEGKLDNHSYNRIEYGRMEKALLTAFPLVTHCGIGDVMIPFEFSFNEDLMPNYEEDLFSGMCAALEVLKQIHLEHGQVIDDVPVFEKRILQPG